jgi:hypothetical protein
MGGKCRPRLPGSRWMTAMDAPPMPRKLKQFVLKPTVFCFHRCPYCDPRQDYYRDMVADRKKTLPLAAGPGARRPNPGHMPLDMPLDMALRTIDEAAALGMEELQLSGGDPLLYPHLVEVIRAASKHPGVFVLMNSVGTGVTVDKAREIIDAGLGAWNFSVDTLDPVLYERLCGCGRGRGAAWPAGVVRRGVVRRGPAGRPGRAGPGRGGGGVAAGGGPGLPVEPASLSRQCPRMAWPRWKQEVTEGQVADGLAPARSIRSWISAVPQRMVDLHANEPER